MVWTQHLHRTGDRPLLRRPVRPPTSRWWGKIRGAKWGVFHGGGQPRSPYIPSDDITVAWPSDRLSGKPRRARSVVRCPLKRATVRGKSIRRMLKQKADKQVKRLLQRRYP